MGRELAIGAAALGATGLVLWNQAAKNGAGQNPDARVNNDANNRTDTVSRVSTREGRIAHVLGLDQPTVIPTSNGAYRNTKAPEFSEWLNQHAYEHSARFNEVVERFYRDHYGYEPKPAQSYAELANRLQTPMTDFQLGNDIVYGERIYGNILSRMDRNVQLEVQRANPTGNPAAFGDLGDFTIYLWNKTQALATNRDYQQVDVFSQARHDTRYYPAPTLSPANIPAGQVERIAALNQNIAQMRYQRFVISELLGVSENVRDGLQESMPWGTRFWHGNSQIANDWKLLRNTLNDDGNADSAMIRERNQLNETIARAEQDARDYVRLQVASLPEASKLAELQADINGERADLATVTRTLATVQNELNSACREINIQRDNFTAASVQADAQADLARIRQKNGAVVPSVVNEGQAQVSDKVTIESLIRQQARVEEALGRARTAVQGLGDQADAQGNVVETGVLHRMDNWASQRQSRLTTDTLFVRGRQGWEPKPVFNANYTELFHGSNGAFWAVFDDGAAGQPNDGTRDVQRLLDTNPAAFAQWQASLTPAQEAAWRTQLGEALKRTEAQLARTQRALNAVQQDLRQRDNGIRVDEMLIRDKIEDLSVALWDAAMAWARS